MNALAAAPASPGVWIPDIQPDQYVIGCPAEPETEEARIGVPIRAVFETVAMLYLVVADDFDDMAPVDRAGLLGDLLRMELQARITGGPRVLEAG